MPDIQLKVNGAIYGGWKSMRLERGMEQCAGMFDLGVTELWPEQMAAREIAPGDECTVLLDGQTVITGYVDEMTLSYSANSHDIAVRGRDKTADLVDCSALKPAGQWSGRKLEQIAADLCKPFGIEVITLVSTGKAFPNFALQQGETVFEAIERMARIRAVLLTNDGKGNLVITRAGTTRVGTPLMLGQNLLEADATLNYRDRFSTYIMKGQAAGGDFFSGKAASQIKAVANDPTIKRYRPLVVVSEGQDIAASLKDRVLWEANVRAARSNDITCKVQGWSHVDGLWEPNTLVHITDAWLRLDAELLIKKVGYQLDAGGSITELTLTSPDAYKLLPLKDTKGQGPGFFWDTAKASSKDAAK
ncbi:phage baseplate assembly protein [Polaromonas sp. JS666]|uniref:phage baseplate assembly protein n=1 Tax=Polaromonas sp. (strain JS666 / ATCC BAA-500) TaxID=296591 RepID=UPI0000464B67|nr:bacteriophage Mu P [Polaromonas sp. JS666]ABE45635.1 bacteriophage Mu P [Polaromonas sp. JS666]